MAPSSGITLDTSKLSEEARKYFLGSEGIAFSADSREDTVDWAIPDAISSNQR